MKVTVDASVWIAAASDGEPHHEECRTFMVRALAARAAFHEPSLAVVEVCAAIARKTRTPALGLEAAAALLATPGLVLDPLDLDAAGEAAELAATTFLKSADAIYLATARRAGVPLVSLDEAHLTRVAGVVPVMRPRDAF